MLNFPTNVKESGVKCRKKEGGEVVKLVQYAGIAIIILCLLVLGGVYVQQTFFPFEKGAKIASVEKQPEPEVKQKDSEINKEEEGKKLVAFERVLYDAERYNGKLDMYEEALKKEMEKGNLGYQPDISVIRKAKDGFLEISRNIKSLNIPEGLSEKSHEAALACKNTLVLAYEKRAEAAELMASFVETSDSKYAQDSLDALQGAVFLKESGLTVLVERQRELGVDVSKGAYVTKPSTSESSASTNSKSDKKAVVPQSEEESPDAKMKKKSRKFFTMKDIEGTVYNVYIFSDNEKKKVTDKDHVWAGASEGDIWYTGDYHIALQKKGKPVFK